MAKKISGPRIATGNRLSDGRVVFLEPDGGWTPDVNAARIAHDDDEAQALESAAQAAATTENVVVEPYLIEVDPQDASGIAPVAHRERMRILGPSVGHSLDESKGETGLKA